MRSAAVYTFALFMLTSSAVYSQSCTEFKPTEQEIEHVKNGNVPAIAHLYRAYYCSGGRSEPNNPFGLNYFYEFVKPEPESSAELEILGRMRCSEEECSPIKRLASKGAHRQFEFDESISISELAELLDFLDRVRGDRYPIVSIERNVTGYQVAYVEERDRFEYWQGQTTVYNVTYECPKMRCQWKLAGPNKRIQMF